MKHYIDAQGILHSEDELKRLPFGGKVIETSVAVEFPEDEAVIEIPDGVAVIMSLGRIPNAERLRLPASVHKIVDNFESCPRLNAFEVDDDNPTFSARGPLLLSKDGDTIAKFAPGCKKMVIPKDVTGLELDRRFVIPRIEDIEVDPGNAAFVMQNGMLIDKRSNSLLWVPNDAKELIIPEGVKDLSECYFGGSLRCESMILPASLKELSDGIFGSMNPFALTLHDSLEICDASVFPNAITNGTMGKALKSLTVIGKWTDLMTKGLSRVQIPEIHAEDIEPVPAGKRPAAAVGFAEDRRDVTTPEGAAYCKYIRANSGKLMEAAFDHPALLRLMCREGLILPRCADAYLAEAEKRGDAEQKAMLLQAVEANRKNVDKARGQKKQKAEEDAEAVLDRAVARADHVGIAEMRFALAGKLMKEGFYWKEEMERKEVARWLNGFGAELVNAVTAKTDALIVGKSPEKSKLEKAKALGIETLDQHELENRAAQGPRVRRIIDDVLQVAAPNAGGRPFEFPADARTVELPEDIAEIGDYAFSECKTLERVCLPAGLKRIGVCAFFRCVALTDIAFPKDMESIGREAFSFCNSLRKVELPEGLAHMGEGAFSECAKLEAVDVPGSIEVLEGGVFCNSALKTVRLGERMRVIAHHAFESCRSIRTLTLPESLVELGEYALIGMDGMTHLTLGPNVETIGAHALEHVKHIAELTIRGSWNEQMTRRFDGIAIDRIRTDDIAALPGARKPAAALCFAIDAAPVDSPRRQSHLRYIGQNVGKLKSFAVDHPELALLMCRENLLDAEMADAYMAQAKHCRNKELEKVLADYRSRLQ